MDGEIAEGQLNTTNSSFMPSRQSLCPMITFKVLQAPPHMELSNLTSETGSKTRLQTIAERQVRNTLQTVHRLQSPVWTQTPAVFIIRGGKMPETTPWSLESKCMSVSRLLLVAFETLMPPPTMHTLCSDLAASASQQLIQVSAKAQNKHQVPSTSELPVRCR